MDPAQPQSQPAEPVYRFDVTRWSQAERITGAATFVLSISLFLPWFTLSVPAINASESLDGVTSHGYLYVAFTLTLVILAYLIARAGLRDTRMLGIPHKGLLALTTAINMLLVLAGFLFKPLSVSGLSGLSVGWSFGSYIALIASAVAFVSVAGSVLSRSATA